MTYNYYYNINSNNALLIELKKTIKHRRYIISLHEEIELLQYKILILENSKSINKHSKYNKLKKIFNKLKNKFFSFFKKDDNDSINEIKKNLKKNENIVTKSNKFINEMYNININNDHFNKNLKNGSNTTNSFSSSNSSNSSIRRRRIIAEL